jgi:hypothetical protein
MTQSGGPEQKPILHRWSVVVTILGIVVAATVAVVLSFRGPEPDPKLFDNEAAAEVNSESERSYASSSTTGGWGPERPTFTTKDTSPTAVLNSITDNSNWGDTRQFTLCKKTSDSNYENVIAVPDAAEVQVQVFVDNASTRSGQDIRNARAELLLPKGVADDPAIGVQISGEGSAIRAVWSGCRFLTSAPSVVSLKPGSVYARTGSRDAPEERPVSDGVITGAALMPATLGGPEGVIPASSHAYGYLTFSVLVQPVR